MRYSFAILLSLLAFDFNYSQIRITEWMSSDNNNEFIEFTNIGPSSIDLTGWSSDDNHRTPGAHNLSSFGLIESGESVILCHLDADIFRANWNLCKDQKIIGSYSNHRIGRKDEINLYNEKNILIDRISYNDKATSGDTKAPRTKFNSAWIGLNGIGLNKASLAIASNLDDAEGSYRSVDKISIANPGKSSVPKIQYFPCPVTNYPPTIDLDYLNTSNFIDGSDLNTGSKTFRMSGTILDPTDPGSKLGLYFKIFDQGTPSIDLITKVQSSDPTVVTNSNLILTGTGSVRNLKIIPNGIGHCTITITVSDSVSSSDFKILYAASAASLTPSKTMWHNSLSGVSSIINLDDNYFLSADRYSNKIYTYSSANSGLPVKTFDYGLSLNLSDTIKKNTDLRSITRSLQFPNTIYCLLSLSNFESGNFNYNENSNRLFSITISDIGSNIIFNFSGFTEILKKELIKWGDTRGYDFSTSCSSGINPYQINGFSTDAMAFGPDSTTLYIGLGAPIVPKTNQGHAIIVPVTFFEKWFNYGNPKTTPTFGEAIELDLGGRGIKEIQRLSNGKYLIFANSPIINSTNSAVFLWSGKINSIPKLIYQPSNKDLNMQGAFQVKENSEFSLNKLHIFSDLSNEILYNDGIIAKNIVEKENQKFRSDIIGKLDLNQCTDSYSFTSINSCNAYFWNGINCDKTGIYTFQTVNSELCDSIATLEFHLNSPVVTLVSETACDSFFWNGLYYYKSGIYKYKSIANSGCDSILELNLKILHHSIDTVYQYACDSLLWNGNTYNHSGIYTFRLINAEGCDSMIVLILNLNLSSTSTTYVTDCDNFTWNGINYTTSGIYYFHTKTNSGCDSTAVLYLTINNSKTVHYSMKSCNYFTWNNKVYKQSGIYRDTVTSITGCDSITVLDLVVTKEFKSVIDTSSCNSFEWRGINYVKTGKYEDKVQDPFGCDSTFILNLTIHNPSMYINTVTSCDSFEWNNQFYYKSGNYQVQFKNIFGCDSIVNLNLTINKNPNLIQTSTGNFDICPLSSIVLFGPDNMLNYSWSTGDTSKNLLISLPGQYWLNTLDYNGCLGNSSINIKVHSLRSDFDLDGVCLITDYLRLASKFGTTCSCIEDLDGDGLVNTTDVLILLGEYGKKCE